MSTPKSKKIDYILVAIALLAAFLNMFNIWQDQTVNGYYTAAVTSMLQSFHNFFFASFDPTGYVTVDKPPVTFWIQTISAYVFGVHGWSVILPQALAGVGSVLLMYILIKPTFGKMSARLASLAFACTPIAAAVSRTNNVDSMLVFTLVLATWMLFRGIRGSKWGFVVAAFGVVGVAFNMKMLQAYMVIPAFYLFYIFASKVSWKSKLKVLTGASAALIALSLSWAVIVDSIPADKRPYMGSSQTNSVLELAFGYNGVSRLTGNKGPGGGGGARPDGGQMPQGDGGAQDGTKAASSNAFTQDGQMPSTDGQVVSGDGQGGPGGFPHGGGPGGAPGGKGGGGGAFNTGTAGPLRLFQSALSGQISWLIPFAAFGVLALLVGIRRKKPLTAKQFETLFWLAWLLPAAAFFSVAGFFHQYYLIMLAAPISALVGAGWTELWNLYRERASWKMWLLPAAIAVTTAFEMYIISPYKGQIGAGWAIGVGTAGAAAALILVLASKKEKLAHTAAILGLLALLAAPLYWASTPLLYGGNSMLPEAGPSLKQGSGMGGSRMGGPGEVNTKLLDYVTKNNTGETYLFAVSRATEASSYIIKTGKAVMAMGGFSGSDPILTVDKLKEMVQNKEIKYFLISSGGFGGGGGTSSELTTWIKEHSTEVPKSEYQSESTQTQQGEQGQVSTQEGQAQNQQIDGGMSGTRDGQDGRDRQDRPMGGGMNGSGTLYEINVDSL
ncbi:glycosyltransferase family 39 protein [Paenibacillus frigoriresistens]|uniref:ArnT family glycosyltransferase n=1 Tax=Paenibacillus alginolyticus TaxID=59839 RepID=UPI001566FBB7|nr:glycosyltransferase family 39 protein [Paenibacillus frigoriresistens]NRF92123.1 glycosyltransferase family 39 protein [Paenibacillus frigoriresistens]